MSLLVLASLALILGLVCGVVYSADVRKEMAKVRADMLLLVSDVEARVHALEDAAKKAGLDLKKAL